MKTIRTLIVDDEPLARRGLVLRLEKFPEISVVGECRNGHEALEAVSQQSPDLVFLDVQMPGMNGFEVLQNLSGPNMPAIVFVTAYDAYAVRAFEANALDYLLKPINDQRLAESVERSRQILADRSAASHRSDLLKLVCELSGKQMTLDAALSRAAGTEERFARKLAIQEGRETNCVDVDPRASFGHRQPASRTVTQGTPQRRVFHHAKLRPRTETEPQIQIECQSIRRQRLRPICVG
jgi:two-component system LytT family response regulator